MRKVKSSRLRRTHTQLWWLGFISFLVLALCISRLTHKRPSTKPLPKVVLTTVSSEDVPIYLSSLGTVKPMHTALIKSQVSGLLTKVLFKEGQSVHKGDPIAEIDDRPFLAQLKQYQGQLAQDEALLANARIDLNRYQSLFKQNSVSEQIVATQETKVRQYQAAIAIDEALIEKTRVNLSYCHLSSPITGRLGLRLVDEGNYVRASDPSGLVVVNSLDPITVIFSLPEDDLQTILPYMKHPISVEAYDRQQNKRLAKGLLLSMDNLIDPSTGTVKLRAQFDNKDGKLFPNQFVNVRVNLKTLPKALVLQKGAIHHGRDGDFVYLFNKEGFVTVNPIKTGTGIEDKTVVTEGLALGQQVVLLGADKLKDGVKVAG